ncbi:GNAT family N-acetyltransferase [Budviciaceae bacterium CWB-B4]|uniref:GNAT family N-acetyltransferase n=1 Tax=Limnobaculum xujianqingii TaxID=2738837 RepID=A0A9D7AH48_9GAMM|nr:GNAT family N-acetyltransferase [Limnobaculum xujianqingii]MBK5072612.1 GNAT family N-acetyltransferase [Limnobaculum xujianqingii]MBK5175921.1 GNAT family N-acetyltransferase [Limnobaculum xujianqingii]
MSTIRIIIFAIMKVTRLQSTNDALFPTFERLYRISFPEFEQRTFEHQAKGLMAENYFLHCYEENSLFVGFVAYWEFADYLYIEHYAISDQVRGQGYGTRLLGELIASTDKTVILEIDPVVDEISQKRLRFYRALGFVENDYSHVHPPYQGKFHGHPLKILSSGRVITEVEYQRFNQDLKLIVMEK